jgi:hypothetical protein
VNKFQVIEQQYTHLRILWYEYWTEEVVFTFPWWIMVCVVIIPYFSGWKLIDKSRIIEIGLVGFNVSGISFTLDQIGSSLGF